MIVAKILLLVNLTKVEWTASDFDTLRVVTERCKKMHNVGVSKFYKKPDGHYHVVCGNVNMNIKDKKI